jgi:hypothetical protein
MIFFLGARGHGYTVRGLGNLHSLRYLPYDWAFSKTIFRQGVYVFGDLDRLSALELELSSRLYRALTEQGAFCLNDPAKVKLRFRLLRELKSQGLNSFRVWKDWEFDQVQFPVFLRREVGHGRPCSDVIYNSEDFASSLKEIVNTGIPLSSLIAIEYCGAEVSEGVFRRSSLLKVADKYVVCPNVHERNWCVKYGEVGCASEWLYEQEEQMFAGSVVENPILQPVIKAFELADIAYGRADFAVVNGRPEVYEINTNPHIGMSIAGNKSPARARVFERYLKELAGAFVSLESSKQDAVIRVNTDTSLTQRLLGRCFVRSRAWPRSF